MRVLRWLFSRPADPLNPWDIIKWWELRRIPYNMIIGFVGGISFVLFLLFIESSGTLDPGEDAVEPLALLAAPFAINFFYTAGWVCESIVRMLGFRNRKTGPVLFAMGTAFSLFVVMVPSLIWGVIWLLETLGIKR